MALDKNNSIRYDDNSAKFFVLAVTKLLSTIKIAYADEKLPFFRHCQI